MKSGVRIIKLYKYNFLSIITLKTFRAEKDLRYKLFLDGVCDRQRLHGDLGLSESVLGLATGLDWSRELIYLVARSRQMQTGWMHVKCGGGKKPSQYRVRTEAPSLRSFKQETSQTVSNPEYQEKRSTRWTETRQPNIRW